MYLTVYTSQQVSTSPLGAHSIESPGCPVATDQSLLLSSGNMSTGVLELLRILSQKVKTDRYSQPATQTRGGSSQSTRIQ